MLFGDKLKYHTYEFRKQWQGEGFSDALSYVWQIFDQFFLKVRCSYINPAAGRKYPKNVDIEFTTACNLRCPYCLHSQLNNADAKHLEPHTLDLILDRLPFRPDFVTIGGVGEPLVNPHFASLLDVLEYHGIKCKLFTNGTLLKPDVCDILLSHSNLNSIMVSIDGAKKDTFEILRSGADFDKWKKGVLQLNEISGRRTGNPLVTGTHTAMSKRNVDELTDIVDLGAELGFKRMHFMDLLPNDEAAQSMLLPFEQICILRDRLKDAGRRLNVHVTLSHRRQLHPPQKRIRCILPWSYILIKANGDIEGCCALFKDRQKTVMGNILHQGFEEIWRGEEFRKFRIASAEGNDVICNRCPYY